MSQRTTLKLLAAKKSNGDPVFEEILVDRLKANQFRIVASPGILLGVAAGDTIELRDDDKVFQVVNHGGNIAVQLYGENAIVDEHIDELAELTHSIDGRAPKLTVLTIPIRIGFARIEEMLNAFCSRHPGIQWFYGNVYDPSDGVTPLDWWK